jgi:hypothetical protein
LINKNLMCKNGKQKGYDYAPNQKVLKKDISFANWARRLVGLTKYCKHMSTEQ